MGRSNGPLRAQHQAVYRQRRKLALEPLRKPWDFMTSAEVKAMAWKAYRVAAWDLRASLDDPRFTHMERRAMFAESLAEMFKDAVSAHAVTDGLIWPVDASTPPYRNYPRVWQMLCEDMPADWNPQYPVYQDAVTKTQDAVMKTANGALRGIGGVAPDVAKRNGIEGVSP